MTMGVNGGSESCGAHAAWGTINITAKWTPYHMWILGFVHYFRIGELDVQELIHRVQCAADREIVLKLDRDLFTD